MAGAMQQAAAMTMSEASPYTTRGMISTTMPIPPIAENCHEIDGGPIRFVVESRALTAAIVAEHEAQYGANPTEGLEDDGGASLHVFGRDDGLEHLRFDCFEKQPHYHYVRQNEQLNQVLFIDEVAIDPIEWTLRCVRDRLPEMLDYAGAGVLATDVRAQPRAVAAGIEKVSAMIGRIAA